MLLNTKRKKTFQFLDLIHQTLCALNFNKLSDYEAHFMYTAVLEREELLLILQWLLPPNASYVIVPHAGWFVSH